MKRGCKFVGQGSPTFVKLRATYWVSIMIVRRGGIGHLLPLEIGTKKQNFLVNVKSAI